MISPASSLLPKCVITFHTSGPSVAPLALRSVVRKHKQVALDWLVALHKHNPSAVVVDDTGLGRKVTISILLGVA